MMNDLSNEDIKDQIRILEETYVPGESNAFNLRALRELLAYREAQGNVVGWKWRLVDMASSETSAWRICLLPHSPGGGAGFETESIPLYAAPQLPAVPDGWISISDRLPESKPGSYEYIVFETLNNRAHHDYWNVPYRDDDTFTPFWNHYGGYVTHWMQLPAAPKPEVK